MAKQSDETQSDDEQDAREFASSPCLMHELGSEFQSLSPPDDWESVRTWRKGQRSRLISARQSLTQAEQERHSRAVIAALTNYLDRFDGVVGFYWPLAGEIDLRPMMNELSDRGVTLALPVIVEKGHALEFWRWSADAPMQDKPVWDIPAPLERNPVAPSVLFIPLLGFDNHGHRLGHGGGYYDRTLAEMNPRPVTVGVGYELGRLDSIYPQDHDIPMDVIVTDKSILKIRDVGA